MLIYCLCGRKADQGWALDYLEYVNVFDHEISLLIRLCYDIGSQFITMGDEIMAQDILPINNALRYYNWGKTLFVRAKELDKKGFNRVSIAETRIVEAERRMKKTAKSSEEKPIESEDEASTMSEPCV
ncbi:unnamed protein product [Adineta steineri]|uniref:Uncharacterized protein n=1 Tax=Adineta steineri TaxID=433720 RepID=A0A815DRQ4_9BILA|nr:unnamed protein product [Adineta steineri]CAF3897456.1 unnamed protein product [Adineta steineri]